MSLAAWWRVRSGMEKLVLVWMIGLTFFTVNLISLHDRAAGKLLRLPPGSAQVGRLRGRDGSFEPVRLAPLQPLRAQAKIALVILFYARREYLERTMKSVLRSIPRDNFAIIMSQDGNEPGMAEFVREKYGSVAIHVQLNRTKVHKGPMRSYHYIADHFKFALGQVFEVLKFDTAEDDMLVAPDFFDYFAGLAPILHSDPTLLCVSAWNDNGMRGLVDETSSSAVKELRRTSVFPGLGWMLTRALWDQELRDKWPAAYWDDWLREPAQTRGRDCVYPTVSRSKTIGEIGSSVGQFYDAYLSRIVLNSVKVDWANEPKEYLNRTVYRAALLAQVAAARTVERKDLEMEMERNTPGAIRVYWRNAKQFQKIANTMGMMNDLKAGLPRSSFEGIVRVLTPNKQTLFVVPEHNPQTTSKGKKKEKKRKQDRKKKKKTTTTTSAPATTTGPDEEWEEDEEQVQETKET